MAAFEQAFATHVGARHGVGCGSGTDALVLALAALGVGPGDEVIVPTMTFIATAEAVEQLGATPVFVDVHPRDLTMDPAAASRACTDRTAAVMPVHLYGRPADLDALRSLCAERGVALIADAAQAHGATWHGQPVATLATISAYSFYPGKNLGAFGDAGAVVTDDADLAADMAMRRNHGRRSKYLHEFSGMNLRMDELQGAILSVKLRHLAGWTAARRALAATYAERLAGIDGLELPPADDHAGSAWHLYVVRTDRRDALRDHLKARGIGCGVHYPIPLHRQPAYALKGLDPDAFPVADRAAGRILSLPMHERMTPVRVDAVVDAVRSFFS